MEPAAAVTLIAVVLVILTLVVYLVAVILELRKITAGLDAVIQSVGGILQKSEPVNGVVETINWGMISYEIPLERFSPTYNGQPLAYAGLASQKRHMAVYLNSVYSDEGTTDWFREAYRATGKKLDIGKSCVRFTTLENLPLDLIGEAIGRTTVDEYLDHYRSARGV